MAKLSDILSGSSSYSLTQLKVAAGNILLGPMEGVEHKKFYVIAGISKDKVCVCSVIINSEINRFILKRPHLLAGQLELSVEQYAFLSHTSYINCAQPLKGLTQGFTNEAFKIIDTLNNDDLLRVQQTIIQSGMLSEEEIADFFPSLQKR